MCAANSPSRDHGQHLIDLTLDAVDRSLLGWLPRHERLTIVAEVEARLRALAPELAAGEANRTTMPEQVLLDAAAGGASLGAPAASASKRRTSATGWTNLSRRQPRSRLALASGVLGIVSLALLILLPIMYVLGSVLGGDEAILVPLLGTHVTAVALGGLLAVALGIAGLAVLNRRDGRLVGHGWAITGLCTGPLPMLVGGLMILLVGAQLLESSSDFTVQNAYAEGSAVPVYDANAAYGQYPTASYGSAQPTYQPACQTVCPPQFQPPAPSMPTAVVDNETTTSPPSVANRPYYADAPASSVPAVQSAPAESPSAEPKTSSPPAAPKPTAEAPAPDAVYESP